MIFNSNKNILPEPSDIAKEHSNKLLNHIAGLIKNTNNKWIDFKTYMNAALYAEKLGYYVAGLEKIGEQGDFITSPEISKLFGFTIANSLSPVIKDNHNFSILEFGAGSGKLACDILTRLEMLNSLPVNYFILDVSPDLKYKQKELINKLHKNIQDKVIFLNTLPENFDGIILANEVIDAMPVNLFEFDVEKKTISEIGLTLSSNNKLELSLNESSNLINDINSKIIPSLDINALKEKNIKKYLIEYNHQAELWIDTVSKLLNTGIIYLIDYGFNKKEYYHPDRYKGTLQCHFRHHVNSDPLWHPGLQDITTHVDFNSIAEIAFKNECEIEAYISQGHFLVLNKIQELLNKLDFNENELLKASQEIKKLTLPHEMGDIFKFLIISKNLKKEYFLNLEMFNKKYLL